MMSHDRQKQVRLWTLVGVALMTGAALIAWNLRSGPPPERVDDAAVADVLNRTGGESESQIQGRTPPEGSFSRQGRVVGGTE
jgi:hypothetical protein